MSALPIAVSRAAGGERWRDVGLLAVFAGWLLYTRIFWALQAAHATLPPCPFYTLTGHPCPFCGGTRSFAYMWEGDISDAVRLYPLGPAIFVGMIASVAGLSAGIVTGRTWTPRLTNDQWKAVGIAAGAAIVISWSLKVFVLGN